MPKKSIQNASIDAPNPEPSKLKYVWKEVKTKSQAGVEYTKFVQVLEGEFPKGKNREARRAEMKRVMRIMRKINKKNV